MPEASHTVVMTGATRGIGLQAALDIFRRSPEAHLVILARAASGEAFAVMGDFNREMDGPEALSEAMQEAAPLVRVTQGHSDPCWSGGAFIDHIFLGGAARDWLVPGSLRVMIYNSRDTGDQARLSDHCPVSVRIRP